jgi:hypothetical protein
MLKFRPKAIYCFLVSCKDVKVLPF